MAIIKKKTWPELFQAILDGEKNFDIRIADFEVNEGDIIVFEEYFPEEKRYTGRSIEKTVKFVLKTKEQKFFKQEDIEKFGFVALGF